jgi:hypothetical protein
MNCKNIYCKYTKPKKCPISVTEWYIYKDYCWGFATTIDERQPWDENKCPCEFFSLNTNKEKTK